MAQLYNWLGMKKPVDPTIVRLNLHIEDLEAQIVRLKATAAEVAAAAERNAEVAIARANVKSDVVSGKRKRGKGR